MSRIDKATVDRILDATDIVDVVSDFVSLKKHGSSYTGLCPFHNDRSPSFSVSRSRGIFKCFSCGKAGSAVSFLMDLENMTYVEALKWLAKKYNIEVQEREMTSAERDAQVAREALYAVNEFALNHFEKTLTDTDEGRDIGLSYFRERGINDAMIARFHLGYSLEKPDDLYKKATNAGFEEKFLVETGVCILTDRGTYYDRFKGRVIYPVYSLSGRVVAFGGRILKKEKSPAKYVNSPESSIYSKSRELYGMYQARNAIAKKKKCILVEGYMDVISMHQAGVENVVASSGTALTEGQVRMIKRFAGSVTLIYDSDTAGIKAALRGINMFIAAGLSLKLVLLPPGEDPDSFAQSHSASEVEAYIAEHEQDIIDFKVEILMKEALDDPRQRSEAINDILRTLALIPDIVEQSLYLDRFSTKIGIPTSTLAAQLGRFVSQKQEEDFAKKQRDTLRRRADETVEEVETEESPSTAALHPAPPAILRAETELMRYVLRHGALYLCDVFPDPEAEEAVPMTVYEYIRCELDNDSIAMSHPLFKSLWDDVTRLLTERWPQERDACDARLLAERARKLEDGRSSIRETATDTESVELMEKALLDRLDHEYNEATDDFANAFVQKMLLRGEDRKMIDAIAKLTSEDTVLSKMYPRVDLRDDLLEKVPRAIYTLKNAIIKDRLHALEMQLMSLTPDDFDKARAIMEEILDKKRLSMEFDKTNGEIVITPKSSSK